MRYWPAATQILCVLAQVPGALRGYRSSIFALGFCLALAIERLILRPIVVRRSGDGVECE